MTEINDEIAMHRDLLRLGLGGDAASAARIMVKKWGWTRVDTDDTKIDSPAPAANDHNTAWFCDTAKNLIGGDGQRRQDYGGVEESFDCIAKLWSIVLGIGVSSEQVALCMVQLKLARLFVTPNHTDSWVDIIGYAALGGQIAHTPGRHM